MHRSWPGGNLEEDIVDGEAGDAHEDRRGNLHAWTTNPHVKTKPMVFRARIYLVAGPDSGLLSIYSNNLNQGVHIPIFGNQSIARIVRAGRRRDALTTTHQKKRGIF